MNSSLGLKNVGGCHPNSAIFQVHFVPGSFPADLLGFSHTSTSRVVIRSNTKHPVVVMQKENTLLMSGNGLETVKASGIQVNTGYNCGLHNSVSENTTQLTLKQPLY